MAECALTFRIATPDDAEALQALYAPYVATSITFEGEVPSVEEFRHRIETRIAMYPYIVAELDGKPIGYAYASRMFERSAYAWAVELSIYTSQDCTVRGLGRQMYARLLDLLTLQGVRTAHGKVTSPNPKSARLHEAMGFHLAGTLKNVGYKLGEWRDVSWYERELTGPQEIDGEPVPVIPFPEIEHTAEVQAILNGE